MLKNRIINLRKSFGYTQTKFAETLGVTSAYISSIESGKTESLSDTLVKLISQLFFCDTDWVKFGRINNDTLIKEIFEKSKLSLDLFAEKTNVTSAFVVCLIEHSIEPSYSYIVVACKLSKIRPPSEIAWKTVDNKNVKKRYELIDSPETEAETILDQEEKIKTMKTSISNYKDKIALLSEKLIEAHEKIDSLEEQLKNYQKKE